MQVSTILREFIGMTTIDTWTAVTEKAKEM